MTSEHHVYLASYDNTPRSARFHWALLIAPKDAGADSVMTTRMYHATMRGNHWAFEHRRVDSVRSPLMLGRVHFANIDEGRLNDVGRILQDPRLIRSQDEGWDCGTWVREAILRLQQEGCFRAGRMPMTESALDNLFEFAERFSEKLVRTPTSVGFNRLPPTKSYTGSRQ